MPRFMKKFKSLSWNIIQGTFAMYFHILFNNLIYINSYYQTMKNYHFMFFVLQPVQLHNEKVDLERNN